MYFRLFAFALLTRYPLIHSFDPGNVVKRLSNSMSTCPRVIYQFSTTVFSFRSNAAFRKTNSAFKTISLTWRKHCRGTYHGVDRSTYERNPIRDTFGYRAFFIVQLFHIGVNTVCEHGERGTVSVIVVLQIRNIDSARLNAYRFFFLYKFWN